MMILTDRIALRGYLYSPLSIATDGYIGFAVDLESQLDRIFIVLAESRIRTVYNDTRTLWVAEMADTIDGSC